ncbi:bifunctional diguanylate cyclase/phosphodiesterase [Oceaniglobus trochenteri]|uniref:bifunctional diguanylate cyclase/phosphodiesterase n=1 Tax=Oceaniglobus trochenteri TaxID=2763260 RepID=UPI001CFF7A9C|nr:diguanylate cyclase [Oceaniglobus trochenteri]
MKDDSQAELTRYFADLILQHTTDAILMTDPQDRVVWLNPGFEKMYGYRLEDFRDMLPEELLNFAESDEEVTRQVILALGERRPLQVEIQNMRKSGEPLWVEKKLMPLFDGEGRHIYNMSVSRDITERKALEKSAQEMIESEAHRQHERRLLSQISEWLYSAKSLDELLMVVKKSMQTLLPEAEGQLYIYSNSRDTLELAAQWGDGEPHAHIGAEDCWALRRGRAYSYGVKAIEFTCGHVQGEGSPYFCLPIIAHGETIGLLHLCFSAFDRAIMPRGFIETFVQQRWEVGLLCAEQISLAVANVQLRHELQDQSVRDPLTNLWNRRWFLDASHKELNRARTKGLPVSLISLDVDHFKKFNDHHGHDAGDIVLREFGSLLAATFKDDFAPCRIGGEEFVVLCSGVPHDQAMARANAFLDEVTRIEVHYGGARLPRISASAGVASFPEDGEQVLRLMKVADEALYAAKDQGRARVVSSRAKPPKRVA